MFCYIGCTFSSRKNKAPFYNSHRGPQFLETALLPLQTCEIVNVRGMGTVRPAASTRWRLTLQSFGSSLTFAEKFTYVHGKLKKKSI